jgi:membrane protein
MKFKVIKELLISTSKQWNDDNISHLSAALSYYTVFSLAPLLVICITIGGFAFGHDYIAAKIMGKIGEALGQATADQLLIIIKNIEKPSATSFLTKSLGVLTLIWGAIGFLGELQNCFNTIWGVQPKSGRHWYQIIKDRFLSFALVLGICFLLLVSLLFSTFITSMSNHLHRLMPMGGYLWVLVDFSISTLAITGLFAVIFKILPDVILKWRDVLLGAFLTALLFSLGKFILTIYFSKTSIATSFGAAASIIIILVWVYYSTQILLLGTAFTKAYTYEFGSQLKPKQIAKHVKRKPPQVL